MGNASSERSAPGQEKAHRRESRGAKDGARPKILMDSTEDADIFQADDAKEFLAWQRDLETDSKAPPEERPTVFRWTGPGKDVYVSGSFNNWANKIPLSKRSDRLRSPPILPPHLLQVLLNKDTGVSCDPTLLPEPNHVMLNHLYALSIKDGVMVLSATHRYKKKYVTTLLYKPI
uniref:Association with the SNF1 complex (ASC) domain-containing protein n=1 Tax=Pygocentrus nattereri TaxID=42514 RepID=A0AAR2LY21_PYGNA